MSGPVLGPRIEAWGNLPEHAMRRRSLERWLRAVSPQTAMAGCEELLVRTRERSAAAVPLYLALVDLLLSAPWVGERMDAWRTVARASGRAELRYLLAAPSGSSRPAHDDETAPHPDLAELTLGERKARARRAVGDDLSRYLRETDPRVLEILLGNPRVDQMWVVRMASRRPQRPEAIMGLTRVPRWLALPEVRRAVVLNPWSPAVLALKLLPLMRSDELRDVLRGLDLPDELRDYARALLDLGRYALSRDLVGSAALAADAGWSS